jgi:hypothetical protein
VSPGAGVWANARLRDASREGKGNPRQRNKLRRASPPGRQDPAYHLSAGKVNPRAETARPLDTRTTTAPLIVKISRYDMPHLPRLDSAIFLLHKGATTTTAILQSLISAPRRRYKPVTERLAPRPYHDHIRPAQHSSKDSAMSRIAPALAAVFAFAALAASIHADDPKNEPKAEDAKPLSAEALQLRLLKHLHDENAKLHLGADLAVKDLTTDTVWDRLKVQVVQVEGEVLRHQTYVIRKDDVYLIGQSFGGSGVNSLCVADLAHDGKPLLLVSYAWGSGEHRSQIAALDCLAKEPKQTVAPLVNFSFKDFKLKPIDTHTVDVLARDVKVGRLAAETKDTQTLIQVRLAEELPTEIKEKLKATP